MGLRAPLYLACAAFVWGACKANRLHSTGERDPHPAVDPIPQPAMDSALADSSGVLMFIGQDVGSIEAYAATVGEPQGVVGYTALDGLLGIDRPTDVGAGVNHLDALAARFPDAPLALGLYLIGMLDRVNAGALDAQIDELGRLLARYPVPVLLRIGYEFDGAWTAYEPKAYVLAYRRIADGVRAQGAHQVEFVWQSMAGCEPTFGNHPRLDWYPGDDYVDWVAASLFVEPTACGFEPQRELVDIARARGKPFYIAEATPQGFDLGSLTQGRDGPDQASVTADEILQRWFVPYFDFIAEHADVIRATTYINAHWDAQAMWGPPYNSGYWGDSRVQVQEDVLAFWNQRVPITLDVEGP